MPDFSLNTFFRLQNNQKLMLLGAVLTAVIGSYIYFVYAPLNDKLTLTQEELTKLQSKYNEQQKVLADLPKFEKEIKELEVKFKNSLKLLPNTREIPSLLTNISTLAQDSGLNILLFQPKPEQTKGFYAEIPVEMKVSGKYHNVGYFFDKVSKLNRIVNICEITIDSKQRKRNKSRNFNLLASFKAVTFKFVEKEKTSGKNKNRKKRKKKR